MKTPVINVNLNHCDTPHLCVSNGGEHVAACAARPILIPCPIQRSVVMEVKLGECTCEPMRLGKEMGGKIATITTHHEGCVARPIRVACDIGGETWAKSEVEDVEAPADGYPSMMRACRERWALVKALVMGKRGVEWFTPPPQGYDLMVQRDAVFAALANMARCERTYWEAAKSVYVAFPQAVVTSEMQIVDPGDADGEAPSARWLAAYVTHLIEQVGVL